MLKLTLLREKKGVVLLSVPVQSFVGRSLLSHSVYVLVTYTGDFGIHKDLLPPPLLANKQKRKQKH